MGKLWGNFLRSSVQNAGAHLGEPPPRNHGGALVAAIKPREGLLDARVPVDGDRALADDAGPTDLDHHPAVDH